MASPDHNELNSSVILDIFQEKSEKLKEVPLGIFTYPVLQSADILLYRLVGRESGIQGWF